MKNTLILRENQLQNIWGGDLVKVSRGNGDVYSGIIERVCYYDNKGSKRDDGTTIYDWVYRVKIVQQLEFNPDGFENLNTDIGGEYTVDEVDIRKF